MQQLTEGTGDNQLIFEFPDKWKTLKYDEAGGFYKRSVDRCQCTKAIDFMVLTENSQLWFEIKNFRGDSENNQLRLNPNENTIPGLAEAKEYINQNNWSRTVQISRKQLFIADEIAQKVRDTCAGVFGAAITEESDLMHFVSALQNRIPIHVVLFLQQDQELDRAVDFRRKAQLIADKIKQQLTFINATVEVINHYTLPRNAAWGIV